MEEQRAEIMRKQQELEKRLKILPAVMEQQQAQKRRRTAAMPPRRAGPFLPIPIAAEPDGAKPPDPFPAAERGENQDGSAVDRLAVIFLILWNSIPRVSGRRPGRHERFAASAHLAYL